MKTLAIFGVLALSFISSNSFASFTPPSPECFDLMLSSENGASKTLCFGDFNWTYQSTYNESTGEVIGGKWTMDSLVGGGTNIVGAKGEDIGVITSFVIEHDFDPVVKVQFNVTAGSSNLTVLYDSVVTVNPAITNGLAYALASASLTDNKSDGASLTGYYDGKLYQAVYNTNVVWAKLLNSMTASGGASVPQIDRYPAAGRLTISDTVSSIKGMFGFTLSAYDSAAGSSKFDIIVPEPATIAILGLGVIGLLRRK